jgi:hypothetical protein
MDTGIFSTSLKALQLQLQSMMEGAGGAKASRLLDGLADVGIKERDALLEIFIGVVEKLASGEKRFFTDEDVKQQEMIDSLYEEVMAQLYGSHVLSAVSPSSSRKKLSAVPALDESPIDLSEYRASRRDKKKSSSCLI